MKYIGAHVSVENGLWRAAARAQELQANAFALFVKNQKRWFVGKLTEQEVQNFQKNTFSFFKADHILAHASYLINLSNPDQQKRQLSIRSLIAEAKRCETLGLNFLVLHPGSSLREIAEAEGLTLVSEGLDQVFDRTEKIQILLENTAGQGGSLGYRLEHLQKIIQKTQNADRLGVCIDTCHLYAAGYNLSSWLNFQEFWNLFEELIGWKRLKGLHLNNSQKACGSRVDRHAPLREGLINPEFFRWLMLDSHFDGLPLILETPEPKYWAEEIAWLRYG